MIKPSFGIALAAVLCSIGSVSQALALDYTVNSTIGAGGVTGTITTDGTFGALTDANVLDWNLVLDNGSAQFTLLGPLSGNNSDLLVYGSFTGTPTDLLLDFSGAGPNALLFQNPFIGSSMNWWALEDSLNGMGGYPSSENVVVGSFGPTTVQVEARSGVQSFASIGVGVPDAGGTALLLGLASVALASVSRRKA